MVDEVRVLVVDDEVDLAEAIAASLAADGYAVDVARDGQDALARIAIARPHCVILDVRMPHMDGLAFARQLRSLHGDDVVLIAISGYPADSPEVAGTFEIVDHYLPKPLDFDALGKVLPKLN